MAASNPIFAPVGWSNAIGNSPPRFIVEVRYREPTYEVRYGARSEPYRFRYRLEARSEHVAIATVVAEFERMNVLSSVGWTRQIVEILVERLTE